MDILHFDVSKFRKEKSTTTRMHLLLVAVLVVNNIILQINTYLRKRCISQCKEKISLGQTICSIYLHYICIYELIDYKRKIYFILHNILVTIDEKLKIIFFIKIKTI